VPRYAAFLRGMNVGGSHRVGNDELRTRFEEMGYVEVSPFRASGNVAFTAGSEPPHTITARIQDELAASLGYQVATFLRSAGEVRAIAGLEPFAASEIEAAGGKLQVSLLSEEPSAQARTDVLVMASDSDSDRLAFHGRELYWLPSGGILESALDLKVLDTVLGKSTRRTKATIEQIAARHFTGR
jgi:uncharacterized protein (DUF1697 family)